MRNRLLRLPTMLAALAAVTALIAGCGGSTSSTSTANTADRAFVQQMIPHHMMAIQMAQTAERQGAHPQITTLAGSIISDQKAEIAQMTAIAQSSGSSPTRCRPGLRWAGG